MADNVLEIIIKADVDKAQSNIANFNKQLPKIGEAANVANKGLQNVSKNSAQAGNAVLNLGRIAQDSAFGFIGIANNIEPFIQSIKSLKSSTEVGTSATKAFFGALAGPAGIGVLIGAISLFDAYINGYGIFANKAKVAEKAQKDFNEELNKVKAPALAAGVQLQAFVDIAANSALPLAQRNKALEEGNKILGDYGTKLTLANVASEAITAQTKLFTKALVEQAVAAKLADRVADLTIKQAEAIKKYSDAVKAAPKFDPSILQSATAFGGDIRGVNQFLAGQKQIKSAATEYKNVTSDLINTQNLANETTAKSTSLFGQLGTKTKDAAEATKANAKALKEQNKELKDANKSAAEFEKEFQSVINPIQKLTETLSNRTQSVTSKLIIATQDLKDLLLLNLNTEQQTLAIQQQKLVLAEKAKIAANISAMPTTASAKLTENVKPVTAGTDAAAEEQRLANLKAISTQVSNITTAFQLLAPVIEAAFGALKGGENATENLKVAIKNLLKELLKAAILSAVISLVTGGAAGGGVSFLSAFKGQLGFRAQGGTVNSKDPYIVGENGPELFVPTASGNIVSNGRFANAGGGGGGILSARVSGGDLLFILNQAGNNRSVNFG